MARTREGVARFLAKTLGRFGVLSEVLNVVDASVWGGAKGSTDSRSLRKLKESDLNDAYHKKSFVRTIVNVFLSFLFAGGGFTLTGKDANRIKELNDFWRAPRTMRDLKRGARQSILTGNVFVGATGAGFGDLKAPVQKGKREEIKNNTSLVLYGSEETTVHFDPFLNRPIKFEIATTISPEKGEAKSKMGRYEIVLTDDEIRVTQPGKRTPTIYKHPFGRPPLVHIAEDQTLNEIYGRGAIDEALYQHIKDYETILAMTVKWVKYHGAPSPVIDGLGNPLEFMKTLLGKAQASASTEGGRVWHPGKLLGIGKNSKAYFLESAHGIDPIELLKVLYHMIVIDSRVPEFLFGVHMKSAQASTKEQLVNILKATEERRDIWTVAILDISELLQLKKWGKAESLDVLWGPAELHSLKERAEVVAMLIAIEAISLETAMRQFPEIIPEVEDELKRIGGEKTKEILLPYLGGEFNVRTVGKLLRLKEQALEGDGFAVKVMEVLGMSLGEEKD